jgi:hypothetical protein
MTISRRARDRDGKIIEPMTLANMRENGVGSGVATCAIGSGSSGLRAQGKPSRHPALSLPNEQDRHHISAHSGKGCGQRHVRVE